MTVVGSDTEALAEFALSTSFSHIPREVTHAAKRVILDTVGCTVAGLDTEVGRVLVRWGQAQRGTGKATLIVHGDKLPCASASYVHSQAANAMDSDETFLHRSHFATCIVMPALAIAEHTGANGQDVLTAVTLGFDVAARVGLTMPTYDISGSEISIPGNGHGWMVFGTVAAVGRLLGLNRGQLSNAFGLGYATAPLRRYAGGSPFAGMSMVKSSHGAIVAAGINAALLASQGFKSGDAVLDKGSEFWRGFGAVSCDWDLMTRDLGMRWFIAETSFKPYPHGRQTNHAVDLFTKIVRDEGLSADEIEEVVVKIPPVEVIRILVENVEPASQIGMPFSVPYAFAMVIAGLPPGPKWTKPDNLKNTKLMSFARKVRPQVNPDLYRVMVDQIKAEGTYRRIPTEVEVRARGKRFAAFTEYAKGDPWGPPEVVMSDDELKKKFREYASEALSPDKTERAIREVFGLDRAQNVYGLMDSLH